MYSQHYQQSQQRHVFTCRFSFSSYSQALSIEFTLQSRFIFSARLSVSPGRFLKQSERGRERAVGVYTEQINKQNQDYICWYLFNIFKDRQSLYIYNRLHLNSVFMQRKSCCSVACLFFDF